MRDAGVSQATPDLSARIQESVDMGPKEAYIGRRVVRFPLIGKVGQNSM